MTDGAMNDKSMPAVSEPIVQIDLTDAESQFLDKKGQLFHAAELSLAQAQDTLATAQREYDQQFGRLQGAVEQLLEMKGLSPEGANVRYDAEQHRVVLTVPAGRSEGR